MTPLDLKKVLTKKDPENRLDKEKPLLTNRERSDDETDLDHHAEKQRP